MKERSFGGMSTKCDNVDFHNHFKELCCNEDVVFYVSNKVYEHREEGLNFDYKYAIRVTDYSFEGEDNSPIMVDLFLVPSFDSLSDKNKAYIKECVCIEDSEFYTDDPIYLDIVNYGFSVFMGNATLYDLTDSEKIEWNETQKIKDVLESISAVYETIDRFRGFYLDATWNRIGSTGWDIINHAINDEALFKFYVG